jgi:alanine racemase
MDLTIFDITDLPENAVRAGDYVELFGKTWPSMMWHGRPERSATRS